MKVRLLNNKSLSYYEVYKVQVALFGGPSILMYNEDRTQQYETQDLTEIKNITKFVQGKMKSFVAGSYVNGKIQLEKLLPNEYSF